MAEEQQQERRKVRVACTFPNGLELRLHARTYDDDTAYSTGRKQNVATGEVILLAGPHPRAQGAGTTGEGPGVINEVDAGLWERWLADNKDSSLVTSGAVKAVE